MKQIRISLLHLAPVPGDLKRNTRNTVQALEVAAARGADWVITPELCLSGYHFYRKLGVDWISSAPDEWTRHVCRQAQALRIAVFLGHVERDAAGLVHNAVFAIDDQGEIVGRHHKVNVHSDGWSTPGNGVAPVTLEGILVGVMICADAYTPHVSNALASQGAQFIISPAAWGPGLHGPNGEWEQRTLDSQLGLVVCNRTGADETLDFTGASSLVVVKGRRRLDYAGSQPAVLTFDWDVDAKTPLSAEFQMDLLAAD